MQRFLLRGGYCFALTILLMCFSIKTFSQTVNFSFTLPASAKTSAGVFASDSTLLKTLWSGVTYAAGTHNATWDGTTDDGQMATNGTYYIKVLSNNITAVWEGTIGNNSDSINGGTVQRGYDRITCMAIAGNYAYYGKNYSEGNPSQLKFLLSKPRQRIQLMPANEGTGQATRFVATDGTTVFWAGPDTRGTIPYYFIFATRTSNDSEVTFSAGRSYKAKVGRTYPSVIDTINNANGVINGLAVQYTGNYLFATHGVLNELHVIDKTTGAIVQNLSYTNAGAVAVDSSDNLWMTYTSSGTRVVEKFTVNTNGTLTSTGVVLSGLSYPVAIAAAPDNLTVVVADAGTSQQLKAFNINSGAASWTYGQAGGYATSSQLDNDKFYFSDLRSVLGSFIAYQPNGSYWVGDLGNARAQKYSTTNSFLERIQYIPHFYSCNVDPNNTQRVFADYMEYKIDYTKPLGRNNGSWILARNWGYNMTTNHEDHNNRLRCVTTLSNGRTYALAYDSITSVTKKWQVVELVGTSSLRFTGVFIANDNTQLTFLYPDGSLRKVTRLLNLGQTTTWTKKNLTGFDASNNPVWGADSVLATAPPATPKDPGYWGNPLKVRPGEITSSDIVVAFDGANEHPGFDNYHLGGIKRGTNKWLWKTAMSTLTDYVGPFPPDGSYDVANNVEYSGVSAMATGRAIIWGYHGEFWKNSQTNMWNIVYDNGLFVNQFGVLGPDVAGKEAPYGMAGNAYGASIVRNGDTAYLYHCDEGHHSGLHRWRITGLDNINIQTATVNFTVNNKGLAASYYNKSDMNNMNHVTSFTDSLVRINYAMPDTNNFSVSYTGYITPQYTENYRIYAGTNKGVRLWVGDKLLVDQRNAATAGEYSDTIRLTAGLRYPVRLEIYHTGGASSVSLSWSSTSQTKTIIPSSALTPAALPDYSNGYNLMEKLRFHQILENGIYGWSRNPANEIDSNQYVRWWKVATGIKAYDRSKPDLYIKYVNKAAATATLSRDLGVAASGVPGWEISGTVNYEGNLPNEDSTNLGPVLRGGSFLEVLDDQGKILIRFFWNMHYGSNICRLYANNKVIATGSAEAMKAIYNLSQSLQLSMTGDSAQVKYGPFAAVTVAKLDAAAHWNMPKTFRFYAYTNTFNSPRIIDFENLKFRTLSSLHIASKKEEALVEEELNKSVSLKIYPNPSNGSFFYMKWNGLPPLVTVTDLQGRVIMTKQWAKSGAGVYRIELTNKLKKGVYVVIVNGRQAERLLVL